MPAYPNMYQIFQTDDLQIVPKMNLFVLYRCLKFSQSLKVEIFHIKIQLILEKQKL